MALKPTIYKANVVLSDLDRDYYDQLDLTIAQHPSETRERMMVRLIAYCLNAGEGIDFTSGLSTPNEPDIAITSLDGQIRAWIDVGEPSFDRIKKACGRAGLVRVYSFNSKSTVWWEKEGASFANLHAEFFRLSWAQVQAVGELVERTMSLSVTISGNSVLLSAPDSSV